MILQKGLCVNNFLYINYKNELFGFCDIDQQQIIPCLYEEVKEFKNENTWVKEKDKWFLINNKNEKVIKDSFNEILLFGKDFSLVKKDTFFYSINNESGKILSKTNEKIIDSNFEIAIVLNEDKTKSFLDIKNLKKDLTKFEDLKLLCEGFAPFKKDNKWGLIDWQLKIIIEPQYDQMEILNSSLIKVLQNNQEFFIDLKNNKYLQNLKKFTYGKNFSDGYITIFFKNKKGCMNDFFEILFLKKIEDISDFEDGYAIFKKRNKYGVIKSTGKILINPIYDKILWKKDNYYFAKRKNQYTYVSLDNKELFKISS